MNMKKGCHRIHLLACVFHILEDQNWNHLLGLLSFSFYPACLEWGSKRNWWRNRQLLDACILFQLLTICFCHFLFQWVPPKFVFVGVWKNVYPGISMLTTMSENYFILVSVKHSTSKSLSVEVSIVIMSSKWSLRDAVFRCIMEKTFFGKFVDIKSFVS